MGTPDFAVPCLEKLIESGHNVKAVISQTDKPVGRKQILTPPEVKKCALEHGIEVFQPKSLKNDEAFDFIKKVNPEIIVVVAYGKILPKCIIDYPKYGCINVHASLLPMYRGAAPIQWAVLNGDKKTGVTVMQMDEGLDTGDMLLQKETDIEPNETSAELFDRLSQIGANALIECLEDIKNGNIIPKKQPENDCEYAKMITKELCPIDWSKDATQIHNQIRGLQTWPVATTLLNGKTLKIHKSVVSDAVGKMAGEVIDNNKKLVVSCGNNTAIEILEVQLDGKKRMPVKDFLQGNSIEIDEILGE